MNRFFELGGKARSNSPLIKPQLNAAGLLFTICLVSGLMAVTKSVLAQEGCDQKQALDMLTRMGTFKHQYMRDNAGKAGMVEKVKELAVRTSHGGTLIGQKQYDAACAHYQEVADDFGFDLSQSKAMSVGDINAYEQNAGEGCDIRSIVQRNNHATRRIAQLKRQLDAATHAELQARSDDLGMLMRTDLTRACQVSKELETDLQGYPAG